MRRALLIGINDYPTPHGLCGCVEDINLLSPLLSNNDDGSKNFDIKLLPNVSMKKEAMKEILDLFSGDGEISLFYFSGHGHVNDTDAELVFPNAVKNRDYYLGLKMSDIMSIVHRSKVRNKIIILDCCHAGSIGKFANYAESFIGDGVSIMCACKENESSFATNKHSLFTEQLCSALSGGASDFCGNITIGSIYAYIDRVFGPYQQRPTFKTNVTEFISLRKVTPKVDIETIKKGLSLFKDGDSQFSLDPSFEDTNTPSYVSEHIEPYADPANIANFKVLQKLQSIGFVEPFGASYMYDAAMQSKSCRLTNIGKYYWLLNANSRLD